MKRNHSFMTKTLALFLVLAMTVVWVPAFSSVAAEAAASYEEAPESLKAENGNLAIGATIISQYGAHSDAGWGWDINLINDGTMNTVAGPGASAETNGGYHTNVSATNEWGQNIFNINHSEWVGYQFEEAKTFDTVVVYPCRDEDGICWGMPNAFAVDVSVDGENFVRVYETYAYEVTEFGPRTIQFEAVTAKYVRFVALSVNPNAMSQTFGVKICELAVFYTGYENTTPYCPNLAEGKTVTSSACHIDGPWNQKNINDGDCYNMAQTPYDWGQFAGWHTGTSVASTEDAWIVIDLGEVTAVDQAVVWPATERYKHGMTDGAWKDVLSLPLTMAIQLSSDGEDWIDAASLNEMPTVWGPITFSFDEQNARYVRLYMTRNGHVKLSEFQVFHTETLVTPEVKEPETVVNAGENLALGATVIYSSVINSGGWQYFNLNNGVVETEGGFTTASGSPLWVGYEFAAPTLVNKIVLYPSAPGADAGVWSGLPKSFTVQYSVDNLNWYDAATYTSETPAAGQEAVTVTFDTVTAKCLRIYTTEPWPKTSDGDRTYIQVSEMEVWYELSSGEELFAPFYQVKENSDASKHDLRIVLVTNLEKLQGITSAGVEIVFTLAEGGTKTITNTLGNNASDYKLYKTVTAAGEAYRAAEGYALFGSVITNIPDGAYTAIAITITDNAGNILLSASTAN